MSGFNLAEMLQKAGVNIDTDDKMQVEHISRDLIVPDENNFYELSGLDELAASIARGSGTDFQEQASWRLASVVDSLQHGKEFHRTPREYMQP